MSGVRECGRMRLVWSESALTRPKASPTCRECRVEHGRGPWAAYCVRCFNERKARRVRRYQRTWNKSLRGIASKHRYEQKVGYDTIRAKARIASQRRMEARGPVVRKCDTETCETWFIRVRQSRRRFCRECIAVFQCRYDAERVMGPDFCWLPGAPRTLGTRVPDDQRVRAVAA